MHTYVSHHTQQTEEPAIRFRDIGPSDCFTLSSEDDMTGEITVHLPEYGHAKAQDYAGSLVRIGVEYAVSNARRSGDLKFMEAILSDLDAHVERIQHEIAANEDILDEAAARDLDAARAAEEGDDDGQQEGTDAVTGDTEAATTTEAAVEAADDRGTTDAAGTAGRVGVDAPDRPAA